MVTKFSEDVVPLTDMKVNPGRVVRHAVHSHRPVLLTSRGRGVAIVQSVSDYEAVEEERTFMKAVVARARGSRGRPGRFIDGCKSVAGPRLTECLESRFASQSRHFPIWRRSRPDMKAKTCPKSGSVS